MHDLYFKNKNETLIFVVIAIDLHWYSSIFILSYCMLTLYEPGIKKCMQASGKTYGKITSSFTLLLHYMY